VHVLLSSHVFTEYTQAPVAGTQTEDWHWSAGGHTFWSVTHCTPSQRELVHRLAGSLMHAKVPFEQTPAEHVNV